MFLLGILFTLFISAFSAGVASLVNAPVILLVVPFYLVFLGRMRKGTTISFLAGFFFSAFSLLNGLFSLGVLSLLLVFVTLLWQFLLQFFRISFFLQNILLFLLAGLFAYLLPPTFPLLFYFLFFLLYLVIGNYLAKLVGATSSKKL